MEPLTQAPFRCCPSGPEPICAIILIILVLFAMLIVTAIKVIISCKIFSKAGYNWALGLLIILPIVDVVMVCFLAFSDWPILRELRQLKQQQA